MRSVVLRVAVAAGLVLSGILACGSTTSGPPGGLWANEPAGFTLVSDYDFSDSIPTGAGVAIGSSGWHTNNTGDASRLSDRTAPLAPYVLQITYPAGFGGGDSPANVYYEGFPGSQRLYVGFMWKASNPWQPHPAGDKIAFLDIGPPGTIFVIMRDGHIGVTDLGSGTNYDPNVTTTPATLGVWHKIEVLMDKPAGNVLKVWVDGVLNLNFSGLAYPSAFSIFEFDPTWGGTGSTKTETDYFWYDHVHLSVR